MIDLKKMNKYGKLALKYYTSKWEDDKRERERVGKEMGEIREISNEEEINYIIGIENGIKTSTYGYKREDYLKGYLKGFKLGEAK